MYRNVKQKDSRRNGKNEKERKKDYIIKKNL